MDARSIKRRVCKIQGRMLILRALMAEELLVWDQMAPVGHEFGSPDFERLMATDDPVVAEEVASTDFILTTVTHDK